MIDLRADMQIIRESFRSGIGAFLNDQPGVGVCTAAFYCCPWAGWLRIALDTPEHSAAHVAQWVPKYAARGMEWTGEDAAGTFCDNAPDFAYRGWRDLEFPHWKAEYESDQREIVGLDGSIDRPPADPSDEGYEGDEGYNRPFHRALVATLHGLQSGPTLQQLKKAAPFRLGVQMLDSRLETFWLLGPP